MADEEGDLLGGLPRSRPGVRSGKRAASARTASPRARTASPRPRPKRSTSPPPQPPAGAAEEALRLAAGAAGTVLGTASSVTRGILRRLPKP